MIDVTLEIRRLNDCFRRSLSGGGERLLTAGIAALPPEEQAAILAKVIAFDAFTEDNDPHGEHDFGSLDYDGNRIFWKESTTTTGAASEPGATWGAKTRAIRPRRCPSSPSCWRPNTDESRGLA